MKILRFLLSPLLGLLVTAGRAQDGGPPLRLFLLVGQSNMAGRGKVEAQDRVTDPRILMLDRSNTWVLARDPVHFDKPAVAGVGLCSQFARDLLAAEPGVPIGLIPCAVGGTSLDQWKPGGKLYTDAVARARVAQRRGRLEAILWHQGESDSGTPAGITNYPPRFAALVAALRRDLDADDVPVLAGELGRFHRNAPAFNAMLAGLPAVVPRCTVVSSEGLTPLDGANNPHFDAASLRTLGSRYAAAYRSRAWEPATAPTPPAPTRPPVTP